MLATFAALSVASLQCGRIGAKRGGNSLPTIATTTDPATVPGFLFSPTDLETRKRHYICSMDAVTILVLMLMFAAAVFYVVRKYGHKFKK